MTAGDVCPSDVELVVFLCGAIRSVADSERKKRIRERTALQVKASDMLDAQGATDVSADMAALEREAECKGMVDALFRLFEGDEEAQLVLMADLEGMSAAEIRDMNGMDETALATVRRRMRRRIEKAYPKGWTR